MTNTETAPQARSGTAGYRMVVPGGWFAVDLDPSRRKRAVAVLVERQFAGLDNAPHHKAQARQELLARAKAAYAAGEAKTASTASASAAGSSGATSRPVTSCSIMSSGPPQRVATTGTPAAAASSTASPKPWPRAARGAAQPVPQLGLADRQGGRPLI